MSLSFIKVLKFYTIGSASVGLLYSGFNHGRCAYLEINKNNIDISLIDKYK